VVQPTVVSFTFDNQWASQMTAVTDLKAHGMAGTFYTISGWIGLPGFLTMANLQTAVADGDEIGGKTVNNSDLPTLSDAEAEREICQGRDVLLADGFKVTDFAYPFADLNAEDETLVKTCGFNSGRGVGDVASVDPGACTYPDCPYAETIPPADPYNIATPDDAEQTTTLADMEKTVTNAESHGGGLLAFSFHQICVAGTAGCDPVYSWSPTLFNNFLTWLQGQELLKGVQVKTHGAGHWRRSCARRDGADRACRRGRRQRAGQPEPDHRGLGYPGQPGMLDGRHLRPQRQHADVRLEHDRRC
jgi:hypothetical protein